MENLKLFSKLRYISSHACVCRLINAARQTTLTGTDALAVTATEQENWQNQRRQGLSLGSLAIRVWKPALRLNR